MSPEGVTFLDHTADVAFDVTAATPARLFDASALAMLALLRGEEDAQRTAPSVAPPPAAPGAPTSRTLDLAASDPVRLLADWLRELLFLHEIDRLDYQAADFDALELGPPCRLRARVALCRGGHAVREIKGVTYHDMHVRPRNGGWEARVIFDV